MQSTGNKVLTLPCSVKYTSTPRQQHHKSMSTATLTPKPRYARNKQTPPRTYWHPRPSHYTGGSANKKRPRMSKERTVHEYGKWQAPCKSLIIKGHGAYCMCISTICIPHRHHARTEFIMQQQQLVHIIDTRGNLHTARPDDAGNKEVSGRAHRRNISGDMRNRGTGEIIETVRILSEGFH